MSDVVRIDERITGFEGVAIGTYAAALLAACINGDAEVRLRRPVPVGQPLERRRLDDGSAQLLLDDDVLAEARAHDLDLDAPAFVRFADAQAAARGAPARHAHSHPGPDCFVCGPNRAPHEGLRIFPGLVGERGVVAGPWTPHPALVGSEVADTEIVWAALDCPAIWALCLTAPPDSVDRVVTGSIATRVTAPIKAGDPHVLIGWRIGGDESKLVAGSALFSREGDLKAIARQTCIKTAWGVPLSGWRRAS